MSLKKTKLLKLKIIKTYIMNNINNSIKILRHARILIKINHLIELNKN